VKLNVEATMRQSFPALVLAVAAATTSGWAPGLAAGHMRMVSPVYPARTPNLNPQRFDPASFVWRTRATEHFDIYHTPRMDPDEIAREAEKAYSRLSVDLGRDLSEKVPLILLPTSGDLPRDRSEARAIVRASRAPEEDHLLLAVEPYDGRAIRLAHELTHIIQFALDPDGRLPAWASEGVADHEAGTWEASDLLKLREALAAGRVPSVGSLTDSDRAWGHALFDFVAAEYGARGIQRYLIALRDSTGSDATRGAFSVAAADFDRAFRRFVSTRLIDR
jgi:hypothetical protein